VQFAVTLTRTATLAVLDNSGRVVRTLGTLDPGNSSVAWNGLGDDGRRVPAGVYFARLATGTEARTTRVVLAR
jgi:flagellar hook assembly protein FlgD